MTVLQNIIFPSCDFNPKVKAFVRLAKLSDCSIFPDHVRIGSGVVADFATYFNSFSVEKWKKYTRVTSIGLHLRLKGKCQIALCNLYRTNNKNYISNLSTQYCSDEKDTDDVYEVDLLYPDSVEKGIFSFYVTAMEDDVHILGGYYYTNFDCSALPDVCFAIDICTFKREKFVNRNMNLLAKTVFAENSVLKDNFEVFISDNGRSLTLENDCNGKIHVYPNRNLGGAGGFGRGMVEILKSPHYEDFTHIIMMDDDIVFSYETLYRSYILVRLLKTEYSSVFIGGAMLKLNNPGIQSENMDNWEVTRNRPIKFNYDITNLTYILKNEVEDKANHLGWWYCIMPIGVVKANNLPLPIFIKRDDIEYGIRNGTNFLTLNGLCVLHEAFESKRSGYLDYYYWRNLCILNAIHFPGFSKETLKSMMRTVFKENVFRYKYDDANLAYRGVEDFLKGVDWLKGVDAVELNNYVINYTYRAEDATQLPIQFSHGVYERDIALESIIRKRICGEGDSVGKKKLILSFLCKAKGMRYVRMNNAPLYMFCGVKTIIHYDETSGKAFITKKRYSQFYNTYRNYRRICKLIDQKFESAMSDYRMRAKELTNLNFWEYYLGLKGTDYEKRDFAQESCIVHSSAFDQRRNAARSARRAKNTLFKIRVKRFLQACCVCRPIRKDRVLFYSHERVGFSCNLKYIAEKLVEEYPDKLDLIWVTKYPETCSEIGALGIKVVKLYSREHYKYQLSSRVIIVNDSFPEKVHIRHGQFTINTWHAGMNYKKIGTKNLYFANKYAKKIFVLKNRPPKMYLAGSQYFIDDTSKSFGFNKKIFVPTGSPRNDVFFRDNSLLKKAIYERYAIPEQDKVVLYAPTFRSDFHAMDIQFDIDILLKTLSERFGGQWKLLFRRHYFVKKSNKLLNKNCIDVSDWDDMNELLAVSDILITDYSSSMWDFAFTKRPTFVFATDIKEYQENDRSLSYPLSKWPFPIAENGEQLMEKIENFREKEYLEALERHLTECGSFDKGNASQQVVDLIIRKVKFKK